VRVTASDVRRRLHHFYSDTGADVRIEIPSGSYTPEFHWTPAHTSPPVEVVAPPLPARARKPGVRLRMMVRRFDAASRLRLGRSVLDG
jgi:hypothetical protein